MKFPNVKMGDVVVVRGRKYVFGLTSTERFDSLALQASRAENSPDEVQEILGRTINICIGENLPTSLLEHAEYEDLRFDDLVRALGG